MVRFIRILIALAAFPAFISAQPPTQPPTQPKDKPMTHHAQGTFTVNLQPVTPPPADGLARFSIDKQLHGDLEGITKGEMISGGDPQQGAAGYVAMEIVTGAIGAKHGTFGLQHIGTMDSSGRNLTVVVVPGSGTGDFKGIAGTFAIQIADGKHSYDLEYTLPQ